ncbi:hypothetical protein BDV10DRAFT_169035 [Aspergillus recurvatus]
MGTEPKNSSPNRLCAYAEAQTCPTYLRPPTVPHRFKPSDAWDRLLSTNRFGMRPHTSPTTFIETWDALMAWTLLSSALSFSCELIYLHVHSLASPQDWTTSRLTDSSTALYTPHILFSCSLYLCFGLSFYLPLIFICVVTCFCFPLGSVAIIMRCLLGDLGCHHSA